MTVTHPGPDSEHVAPTDEAHDQHHPTDGTYWKVGLALAVITLLEISTYFIADPPYDHELGGLLIGSLIVMMVLKFIVILAYFMHVKFDNKLFRNVFTGGLLLAVAVYIATLATFEYFSDRYEDDFSGEPGVQIIDDGN